MVAAISGLSQMTGQPINVNSLQTMRIPVTDAPDLVGGREAITATIYVGVSIDGTDSGHMAIVYPPQTAFDLIDLIMGEPPGSTSTLEEMEESVLGEVGNVMGSHFLNTLADYTGLDLRVSPPAVMMDMAGSVLDATLATLLVDSEDAVVLDAKFGTDDRQIGGRFLVMPNPVFQDALMAKLAVS